MVIVIAVVVVLLGVTIALRKRATRERGHRGKPNQSGGDVTDMITNFNPTFRDPAHPSSDASAMHDGLPRAAPSLGYYSATLSGCDGTGGCTATADDGINIYAVPFEGNSSIAQTPNQMYLSATPMMAGGPGSDALHDDSHGVTLYEVDDSHGAPLYAEADENGAIAASPIPGEPSYAPLDTSAMYAGLPQGAPSPTATAYSVLTPRDASALSGKTYAQLNASPVYAGAVRSDTASSTVYAVLTADSHHGPSSPLYAVPFEPSSYEVADADGALLPSGVRNHDVHGSANGVALTNCIPPPIGAGGSGFVRKASVYNGFGDEDGNTDA